MKTKATIVIASMVALLLLSGMAAAGERMVVSTDNETYAIGEDVTIEIVNQGKEPAKLSGYWVEDAGEQVIYNPPMLAVEEYLEPGESRRYVWTQIDDSGAQVPAGIYTINIEESSAPMEILANPLVLSSDKAVYESGEDVVISLTNEGDSEDSASHGYSVLDEKGNLVYAPEVLCYEVVLQPGESIQYLWEQIDDKGNVVPDGTYIICAGNTRVSLEIVSETPGYMAEETQDENNAQRPGIVPDPPMPEPKARKMF